MIGGKTTNIEAVEEVDYVQISDLVVDLVNKIQECCKCISDLETFLNQHFCHRVTDL